ncbi:hypothetical protein FRB90_008038 [Tulasnella sp. 427]|nr:hypothetical protein FRB90_008038 [Tulasnella sp. 427]
MARDERSSSYCITLENVPGLFDPSPYLALKSLRLKGALRVRYTDFLPWLRTSSTLQDLHLKHLEWLDTLALPSSDHRVSAGTNRIKTLILVETSKQSGLANLLYYLDISECAVLQLHTAANRDFAGEKLARRLGPLIEQTLGVDQVTYLDIWSRTSRSTISWASAFGDDKKKQEPRFQVSLTTQGQSQPAPFLSFVRRVTELAGQPNSICLDVHDSLSGATRRDSGTGAVTEPTCWSAESFEHIAVTDVEGEALKGYPGETRDLPIQNLQPTFPLLNSIHLRYIPSTEIGLRPRRLARQGLDGLVEDIRRAYKQIEEDKREVRQVDTEDEAGGGPETRVQKDEAERDEAEQAETKGDGGKHSDTKGEKHGQTDTEEDENGQIDPDGEDDEEIEVDGEDDEVIITISDCVSSS